MSDLSWRFKGNELKYIKEVLDSGFGSGTSGTMNSQYEKSFAKRFGLNHAITCNSGTTTLQAALWGMGVGYGDEVLVTPLTVISCINVIIACNAIPVFVDIDPDTFLMDPEDMERKITPKTKAVMAVHLYGQVCDMTRIMEISNQHNLKVLEDCAQCFLGTHKGQIGGTIGDIGSWSTENSKHLSTGDGGILSCNSFELATQVRKLTTLGFRNASADSGMVRVSKDIFQDPDYKRHDAYGFNFRLPEVAAAIGLAQLEQIDEFVNRRVKMAEKYIKVIEDENCTWLKPQYTPEGDYNSYYTFAMKYEHPTVPWKEFRKRYVENGGDGIYAAWALLYQEDCIDEIESILASMGLGGRMNTQEGNCPVAEKVQKQLMQLTTNQGTEEERIEQAEVLRKTIKEFQ